MKCPVDNTTLQMTSREGIEIDYCPECRGVWLDRGELDKLIERSESVPGSGVQADPTPRDSRPVPREEYRGDDDDDYDRRDQQRYDDNRRYDQGHDSGHGHERKKKKEGFLGDLFDF